MYRDSDSYGPEGRGEEDPKPRGNTVMDSLASFGAIASFRRFVGYISHRPFSQYYSMYAMTLADVASGLT